VDEFHMGYDHYHLRVSAFLSLGKNLGRNDMQTIYVTGSHPPHLQKMFEKIYQVQPGIKTIRASTDRPELSYHVINVECRPGRSSPVWLSTVNLVKNLKSKLKPGERILVFFESTKDVESFAATTDSAMYHSQLPSMGKTKAYNMDLWDRGERTSMVASSSMAHGLHRDGVRYVIIYQFFFGMNNAYQAIGRGGRDGIPSYVILVNDARLTLIPERGVDTACRNQLIYYTSNNSQCRRFLWLETMDGELKAQTCHQTLGCHPCDICDPDSEAVAMFRNAMLPPAPLVPTAIQPQVLDASTAGLSSVTQASHVSHATNVTNTSHILPVAGAFSDAVAPSALGPWVGPNSVPGPLQVASIQSLTAASERVISPSSVPLNATSKGTEPASDDGWFSEFDFPSSMARAMDEATKEYYGTVLNVYILFIALH
jgi:hypothetical protein